MPETSRLYALTSTYTNPWWPAEPGPSLLINDPVMAARWYLDNEQEENLAVTARISTDHGATWQVLPPRELWAHTLQHLDAAAQSQEGPVRRAAAALREQLDADAAEWIDRRIRFVEPDNPAPYRPDTPTPSGWQRGGEVWALALGTVPPDPVLERLTAQYADPRPEGPDQARAAARQTLDALATAQSPQGTDVPELLQAYQRLELLTFPAGQLHELVLPAQDNILNQLATRLPETADVIATHPDPEHPVRKAAATYLHRLARRGPGPHPDNPSVREAHDALAAAITDAARAEPTAPDGPPPALPGPRLMTDLDAAAAWRARSPAARRDAEMYMGDLVRAHTRLVTASADAAAQGVGWLNARPRDPAEAAAVDSRDYFEQRLKDLNARHSVLMHGSVLAEAETTAVQATHQAVVDAAQATLPLTPRTTVAETEADHDAFMAHVTAAEQRIDQVLAEQRQHARDALQRHFPETAMYELRTRLMDRAGLGPDSYQQAYQAVGDTVRALEELSSRLASGTAEFGRPPVTAEQVAAASARHAAARQHFDDLSVSQPRTLEALNALDRIKGLAPTGPEGRAARIAQITAQSRERAQNTPSETEPVGGLSRRAQPSRHIHDGQAPQSAPRPGMR
ncbi:hypothetical protein ACFRR6_02010 [Streptomyces sp. NPDC056891]|uniref:hypothetical protein n=1 Tax=Streptomyces sp. NPDC056891 TaxID=3345961 RepID=UPI0036B08E4D